MTEDHDREAILAALQSADLAEAYLDENGQEAMRLTAEGASLAEEMGILAHGPGADDTKLREDAAEPSATQPLDLRNSWGTAVGAAMLGFEQALRSGPPPEVVAGEHVPERGYSGRDGEVIIEFPEAVERRRR